MLFYFVLSFCARMFIYFFSFFGLLYLFISPSKKFLVCFSWLLHSNTNAWMPLHRYFKQFSCVSGWVSTGKCTTNGYQIPWRQSNHNIVFQDTSPSISVELWLKELHGFNLLCLDISWTCFSNWENMLYVFAWFCHNYLLISPNVVLFCMVITQSCYCLS